METTLKPGVLMGALVGAMLTAPLMALFFLGDRLAGLAFVPLDLFDWIARNLPGGLITFGIDRMIDVLLGLGVEPLDAAAKTAEQFMGLVTFFSIGVIAGAVFFFIMRRRPAVMGYIPGLILGIIVGLPLIAISISVNVSATADPLFSALWAAALFLAWGAAFSWLYNDLTAIEEDTAKAKTDVEAQPSRRRFLINVGGATATLTVVGAGLGALLSSGDGSTSTATINNDSTSTTAATDGAGNTLPNADAVVQAAPGTRPEYTPIDQHYRIDISSRPPVIDGDTWSMPIRGLVENEVSYTLDQLRNDFEPVDQYVTLACISNRIAGSLVSTTRWTGIPMRTLLEEAGPLPEAGWLKISSADAFFEYVSLDLIREDERVMLCYAWDGEPLRERHGFPVRIYIPDRYGMKQPKWIINMEVVADWDEGYWVRRGWSREAIMNATSVIDTVSAESAYEADGTTYVPIGGIAHAGARSISRVEVSIDSGEWVEAQIREPLSDTTWVVWRYDWAFEEGSHVFAVRCYEDDEAMTPQVETVRGTRPDGATGIHSVQEFIRVADADEEADA